jgi:hypothetical protein
MPNLFSWKDYTKGELQALAERRNIPFPPSASKANLVEALAGAGVNEEDFYRNNTLKSLIENCAARGVAEDDLEKVLAEVQAMIGVPLRMANYGQLKRVNRDMPHMLTRFLGGAKRAQVGGSRAPTGIEKFTVNK